ncbi:MAG: hypothetical protein M3454_15055 [Actinomycetota bacterium]|nr:hypothetical protein [Actinomycetota bacterium]
MAALSYLLPPVTGLLAYLLGSAERTRRHGLQSVAFGLLWPVALYGAAALSPGAAQAAFAVGGLVWVSLLLTTAVGLDLHVPGTARWLGAAAAESPSGR